MPEDIILKGALAAAFSLLLLIFLFFTRKRNRHKINIKRASIALARLKEIDTPYKQFSYLRKIDPFVFEEMILTAIQRQGGKVIRNRRYTCDGGIDGKATINGNKVIIQAKRYSNHILSSHVDDFVHLCSQMNRYGLFVHTGKTGLKSKELTPKNIDIISGSRLLNLLLGFDFSSKW